MRDIGREEAAAILLKEGYQVDNTGTVLTVWIGTDRKKELGAVVKAVGGLLRGSGYQASYGVKVGERGKT